MTDRTPRIVLFGATGYTGRITAQMLVSAGTAPVLVGRSKPSLVKLADELDALAPGGRRPSYAVANADDAHSVRELLRSSDDVLISTVGPFKRHGAAAIEAAIDAGAAYVDSTGEPSFIRRVFEDYGHRAEDSGARLLTAFGYDYVPGNLAAGILLSRLLASGASPARVDVGYFVAGPFSASAGTMASAAGIMLDESFALRDGSVRSQRSGARVRSFQVGEREREGVSIGGTEHFTLPRFDPRLREANVFVGWSGRWSRAASAVGAVAGSATRLPGVGSAMGAVVRTALGGAAAGATRGGPPATERARARSVVVAEALASDGVSLGRVTVEGPNPYDLTGQLLVWGARMLSRRAEKRVGAMGPLDAFGLEALVGGCLALGLAETG